MRTVLFTILMSSILLGCQSKPLLPVAKPNPPVVAVQQDINAHKNQPITWGGVILKTNNAENQSEVLIISKRLTTSTRPVESDQTLGRFIARVDGFLDPAIYSEGREMSVYGIIVGKEYRKVDDFDYTYPVVQVNSHQLWPVRIEYDDDHDHFWYGPYYHPYPYYYPYYHHHPRSIKSIEKH